MRDERKCLRWLQQLRGTLRRREENGVTGRDDRAEEITAFSRGTLPFRVHSAGSLLLLPMKSPVAVLSASLLLAVLTQTAVAQIASPQQICSSRMTGKEKAQCLVEQHREILR